MTVEQYYISKTFVADWALQKLDGTPASDATVTGTVGLPDGVTTAVMTSTWVPSVLSWRFTYDPTTAGRHTYKLQATGTADSLEEGFFYVQQSLLPALPITLDTATPIGLARLFATDVTEASPIFTDDQWTGFLAAYGGDARRAAARALEVIAASEVLVSKVIRTQDLQTDGAKVSAELRALAASLRAEADAGYGNDGLTEDADAFQIVDYNPNQRWLERAELIE